MEKPDLQCIKCGSPLAPKAGTGRPAIYCGESCRRLVEYEIRRLDRRIAAYELELRGLRYDGPDDFDDTERQKRMRALRRWVTEDEARLLTLLGGAGGRAGADQSNGATKQPTACPGGGPD